MERGSEGVLAAGGLEARTMIRDEDNVQIVMVDMASSDMGVASSLER